MPQADTECGQFAGQFFQGRYDIRHRRRVARTVGDKQTVGFDGQDLFGRGRGGKYMDLAVQIVENSQNIKLDPAIQRGDRVLLIGLPGLPALGPNIFFLGGDLAHPVGTDHRRYGIDFLLEAGGVKIRRGDDRLHRALLPQMTGQRAGIDPLDRHDFIFVEIVNEALCGPVIGVVTAEFLDHKPLHMDLVGFHVFVVDAVIADQRIGHDHDLPCIRRIRQDFLIAAHSGVEYRFTSTFPLLGQRPADKARPVF